MQYKEIAVGGTVYFWFASNLTTGAAGDGATPLYDVRLAGAAASAIPTASGTPTLLTHANYSDGLHEIAIDTTGYAEGEYAVFCTLTISTVNPAGFVGSFVVRAAASTLRDLVANIQTRLPVALTVNGNMKSSMMEILATALTETAGLLAGGFKKFFNVAAPTGTVNSLADAVPGAAGGLFIAGTNAATSITTSLTANVVGNITGNVSGSVGSVTGAVGSVTAGVTLAASAVQAIWDAATSALTTAGSIGKRIVDFLTGDAFVRLGDAGAGLTALGDTRIANLDALVSSRTKPADTQAAVTNLTNAPTAGDFTATMKTSLNAATPAVTVSDKTGFSLSTAGIQAIWDALTSALTTVGSIGKLVVDNITGNAFTRLGAPAGASIAADIAAAKGDTAAIKTKTDQLTFGQTGHVDANVQRINDVAITGNGVTPNKFGV